MSYDFGSETLGIKNPFKIEGRIKSITGLLLLVAGVFPLLRVASVLKHYHLYGYAYALIGFALVSFGCWYLGSGVFQLFRYYVGRTVPTSLAFNHSRSEVDTAQQESGSLLYTAQNLYSMLMGRKNTTFVEPVGWSARLIHTLIPKLIFLPYPLRHVIQEMTGLVVHFLATLVCFLIVMFVVTTGLAGAIAQAITMPILSVVLMINLLVYWVRTIKSVTSAGATRMTPVSVKPFGVLIALCVLVPVITGYWLDALFGWSLRDVQHFAHLYPLFNAWAGLGALFVVMLVVAVGIGLNMVTRLNAVSPLTEVSEYRDNLQENVHPKEIFINIENMVMANRRYKEIPNRVYVDWDTKLTEQTEGKGEFFGELLVETQPEFVADQPLYRFGFKLFASVLASGLLLVSFGLVYYYGLHLTDMIEFMLTHRLTHTHNIVTLMTFVNQNLFGIFTWIGAFSGWRILSYISHLFWGEMRFNSLLMMLQAKGTYTESRLSTGMALHDSTRSENTVIRSSITPWVITSRIETSIFSTSGFKNLEAPRYIMAMHKNDKELNSIIDEIKSFLGERETIAGIHNAGDLQNASTIHQVNEQTRSHLTGTVDLPVNHHDDGDDNLLETR